MQWMCKAHEEFSCRWCPESDILAVSEAPVCNGAYTCALRSPDQRFPFFVLLHNMFAFSPICVALEAFEQPIRNQFIPPYGRQSCLCLSSVLGGGGCSFFFPSGCRENRHRSANLSFGALLRFILHNVNGMRQKVVLVPRAVLVFRSGRYRLKSH